MPPLPLPTAWAHWGTVRTRSREASHSTCSDAGACLGNAAAEADAAVPTLPCCRERADGPSRWLSRVHSRRECVHAMAGCTAAIGADNLLIGSLSAMRTLAAHMLTLYTSTPAANLSRAYRRVKPHHEAIVPIEIRRLGLCCPELDAFVKLSGTPPEARPSFEEHDTRRPLSPLPRAVPLERTVRLARRADTIGMGGSSASRSRGLFPRRSARVARTHEGTHVPLPAAESGTRVPCKLASRTIAGRRACTAAQGH